MKDRLPDSPAHAGPAAGGEIPSKNVPEAPLPTSVWEENPAALPSTLPNRSFTVSWPCELAPQPW